MAQIPAASLPRMKAWWTSLDGGTQAMFEAIYMDAPQAVSRVVSGGTWEADSPEPGLAAQLGGDDAFTAHDNIPTATLTAPPEVRPFHPGLGQPADISWTEINSSQANLPAYVTDVYVTDGNGANVASIRLQNAALAVGASAQRTYQFPGAAAAGTYNVMIYINSEGSDPGSGVPGPQGYRGYTSAQFDAGGDESMAQQQDYAAWSSGAAVLAGVGVRGTAAERIAAIEEGVNWLAAHDGLTEVERKDVEDVGTWATRATESVSRMNPDDAEQVYSAARFDAVGGAATGATYPGDAERQRLLAALKALAAQP